MSTPCSIAGGKSIGSRAAALPSSAAGDCPGGPCGAGRAIHGSAAGAAGACVASGGGGGGTGPGTGQLPVHCATAAAGIVRALRARIRCRVFTCTLLGNQTERLQNLLFSSTRITHLPAEVC